VTILEKGSYKHWFTVFTPTYNRAHTLERTFNSLMEQSFKDFEWLVVDDGSNDDTDKLIIDFQKKAFFPIRYIYKENGGKHTANNIGLREAKGVLYINLGSDDALFKNALQRAYDDWSRYYNYELIREISYLTVDENNSVLGSKFPEDVFLSNCLDLFFIYKITGDKIGVSKTDIIKRFPFPEEKDMIFVTESIVWFRIARVYKSLFLNKAILKVYRDISSGKHLSSFPNTDAMKTARIESILLLIEENADYYLKYRPFLLFKQVGLGIGLNYFLKAHRVDIKQRLSKKVRLGSLLYLFSFPLGIAYYFKKKFVEKRK
jgi:glycosyltransferase involved in cell wall biosynthesis